MAIPTQEQIDQGIALLRAGLFDQANRFFEEEQPGLWNTVAQAILVQGPAFARVPLVAADAAGGLLAWENTTGADLLLWIVLDVTTAATGAHTADFGTAATAIASDNLLDELDLGTAAGVFSSSDDPGANGRTYRKLLAGEFVTGSTFSGAAAGLAGTASIHYWNA